MEAKIWLIDFSDTLVTGSKTWAFEYVFPQLIRENNLPFDEQSFKKITLAAQQKANETQNDAVVLNEMFVRLNWPDHLKAELIRRVFDLYEPQLFDDTIPFLEKLKQTEQKPIIVSNTRNAPEIAQRLGIDKYFDHILTPAMCDSAAPKPDIALWTCLKHRLSLPDRSLLESAIVIGDDPWSDGAFATRCGLPCWIVDRNKRMASLRQQISVKWAHSLLEIPVKQDMG